MKDIKELIYAAVEENAVKFQELVNAQLQVRAYDAIEALRPEVGASMFGEAKKMDDEEEMEDEDEEMEDEDEEMEDEMDDKKKSMKEALHPNQQKIDVVDDEKIDAKDFAKLRKMKKEEVVNEVAMPKNAVDWQALITHQIKTAGHPVATDAQFRATSLGKDKTKIASLEPGEDKMQYAAAQGGNVKEESEVQEASYSAKAARAGKDIGKPGKMFDVIAKKAGEKYGSEERGKKVAGAVLAKLRAK